MRFSLRKTENIWVLGAFLCAVGLLSALLLGTVNEVTKKPIAAAKERALAKNLKLLVPDFDTVTRGDKKLTLANGSEAEIYYAKKAGKLVAVIAKAATKQGYAGKIEMLVALTPQGEVLQVMVTEQKETPGLGADVCTRKFVKTIHNFTEPTPEGLPPNALLDQYAGKSAGGNDWRVSKDGGNFDFKTGATVTSRALTALVGDVVTSFAASRETLLEGF